MSIFIAIDESHVTDVLFDDIELLHWCCHQQLQVKLTEESQSIIYRLWRATTKGLIDDHKAEGSLMI